MLNKMVFVQFEVDWMKAPSGLVCVSTKSIPQAES